MNEQKLKELLQKLEKKKITAAEVVDQLKQGPFENLSSDFFTPDHHRSLRMGFGEVIYSP